MRCRSRSSSSRGNATAHQLGASSSTPGCRCLRTSVTMIGVREASGARVRSSRAALDDIHSSHCDPADMIHVMGSLDRRQVALRRSIAEADDGGYMRSEEHTSELQSRENLVCRLLL